MTKRMVFALAVLALPLLVVGCSKPPEVEMQKANATIQAARAAEADMYAPQSLAAAQDTLNLAMQMKQEQDSKFALFRSYGKAKAMFVRADVAAQKATADAQAEKERVRLEVTDLLAQVRGELDAALAALNAAPVGKGNKAEIELIRTDLTAIGGAYDEAKMEFDGGKYLSAKAKVEAVRGRVAAIVAEIQKAVEKKAGKR